MDAATANERRPTPIGYRSSLEQLPPYPTNHASDYGNNITFIWWTVVYLSLLRMTSIGLHSKLSRSIVH